MHTQHAVSMLYSNNILDMLSKPPLFCESDALFLFHMYKHIHNIHTIRVHTAHYNARCAYNALYETVMDIYHTQRTVFSASQANRHERNNTTTRR